MLIISLDFSTCIIFTSDTKLITEEIESKVYYNRAKSQHVLLYEGRKLMNERTIAELKSKEFSSFDEAKRPDTSVVK